MKDLINYISISLLFCTALHARQQDSLKINYNYINTVPQNANVYMNGEIIGQTPLYFAPSPDKPEQRYLIKLDGYADLIYSSEQGEIINKTFKLVPLNKNIRTETVYENRSYAFPDKISIVPLIISSAVTAVTAVLAYYYKSLAINKQEEFEEIRDPSLLDKKKKYDVLGGLSIAAFQIGFASLLYFHFVK